MRATGRAGHASAHRQLAGWKSAQWKSVSVYEVRTADRETDRSHKGESGGQGHRVIGSRLELIHTLARFDQSGAPREVPVVYLPGRFSGCLDSVL